MIELTFQNGKKLYINPDKIIYLTREKIDITNRDMSAFAKKEFLERTEITLTENIIKYVQETPKQITYIIKKFYENKGIVNTSDWDGI